jgi:hypothetical protein
MAPAGRNPCPATRPQRRCNSCVRFDTIRPVRIVLSAALIAGAIALAALLLRATFGGLPGLAHQALVGAVRYELLSLNPHLSRPDFYNHEILGRVAIVDRATRERLNSALAEGARRSDGTVMACFNPRHGIRLTDARGVVTDVVICFECRQVQVMRDGKQIAAFTTDASPQAAFDEVLRGAGVPLAAGDR